MIENNRVNAIRLRTFAFSAEDKQGNERSEFYPFDIIRYFTRCVGRVGNPTYRFKVRYFTRCGARFLPEILAHHRFRIEPNTEGSSRPQPCNDCHANSDHDKRYCAKQEFDDAFPPRGTLMSLRGEQDGEPEYWRIASAKVLFARNRCHVQLTTPCPDLAGSWFCVSAQHDQRQQADCHRTPVFPVGIPA